jgi:hypothetical protein
LEKRGGSPFDRNCKSKEVKVKARKRADERLVQEMASEDELMVLIQPQSSCDIPLRPMICAYMAAMNFQHGCFWSKPKWSSSGIK